MTEDRKDYYRKYHQEHREQRNRYERKYREFHKEQRREYMRKYYQKHSECYKELYQKHKDCVREQKRKYRHTWRMKVFEKLGNKCVRCGFSDIRALQIDHVNGGGVKELRELNGDSPKFYNKVLADTNGNYQILCANCNWIKKSEKGENVK